MGAVKLGDTFGRWTVRGVGEKRGAHWMINCECQCGRRRSVYKFLLANGRSRSCGCLKREALAARMTTHGGASKGREEPLYKIWEDMRARCNNPHSKQYADYGGRGITICRRWNDYAKFREDMLPGYRRGLTIERRNNAKGYSPSNCRWATRGEQARNRRDNVYVQTLKGRMLCVDAAALAGVKHCTMLYRVKAGWPVERMLSPPRGG